MKNIRVVRLMYLKILTTGKYRTFFDVEVINLALIKHHFAKGLANG